MRRNNKTDVAGLGIFDAVEVVEAGKSSRKIAVSVCVTPGKDEKKSAEMLSQILDYADQKGLADKLVVETAFAPSCTKRQAGEVLVGGRFFDGTDLDAVKQGIEEAVAK